MGKSSTKEITLGETEIEGVAVGVTSPISNTAYRLSKTSSTSTLSNATSKVSNTTSTESNATSTVSNTTSTVSNTTSTVSNTTSTISTTKSHTAKKSTSRKEQQTEFSMLEANLVRTLNKFWSKDPDKDNKERMQVVKQMNFMVKDWAGRNGGRVFLTGSSLLGVADKESDLDIIAIVSKYFTRHAFFYHFYARLTGLPGISDLRALTSVKVPLIKFVYNGFKVDLTLACIVNLEYIPDNEDILDQPRITNGLDVRCLRSLIGFLSVKEMIKKVPDLERFKFVLRLVKVWARRQGIYGNNMAYLGGTSWAILVAKVCLMEAEVGQQEQSVVQLVMKFFEVFSTWPWPNPVHINLSTHNWSPDVMPIITASVGGQQMNSSCNMEKENLSLIMTKLAEARDICKDILVGTRTWPDLLKRKPFHKEFEYYIEINAQAKGDFSLWYGLVESKLRGLCKKLRTCPTVQEIVVWPKSFSGAKNVSRSWFIGCRFQAGRKMTPDMMNDTFMNCLLGLQYICDEGRKKLLSNHIGSFKINWGFLTNLSLTEGLEKITERFPTQTNVDDGIQNQNSGNQRSGNISISVDRKAEGVNSARYSRSVPAHDNEVDANGNQNDIISKSPGTNERVESVRASPDQSGSSDQFPNIEERNKNRRKCTKSSVGSDNKRRVQNVTISRDTVSALKNPIRDSSFPNIGQEIENSVNHGSLYGSSGDSERVQGVKTTGDRDPVSIQPMNNDSGKRKFKRKSDRNDRGRNSDNVKIDLSKDVNSGNITSKMDTNSGNLTSKKAEVPGSTTSSNDSNTIITTRSEGGNTGMRTLKKDGVTGNFNLKKDGVTGNITSRKDGNIGNISLSQDGDTVNIISKKDEVIGNITSRMDVDSSNITSKKDLVTGDTSRKKGNTGNITLKKDGVTANITSKKNDNFGNVSSEMAGDNVNTHGSKDGDWRTISSKKDGSRGKSRLNMNGDTGNTRAKLDNGGNKSSKNVLERGINRVSKNADTRNIPASNDGNKENIGEKFGHRANLSASRDGGKRNFRSKKDGDRRNNTASKNGNKENINAKKDSGRGNENPVHDMSLAIVDENAWPSLSNTTNRRLESTRSDNKPTSRELENSPPSFAQMKDWPLPSKSPQQPRKHK